MRFRGAFLGVGGLFVAGIVLMLYTHHSSSHHQNHLALAQSHIDALRLENENLKQHLAQLIDRKGKPRLDAEGAGTGTVTDASKVLRDAGKEGDSRVQPKPSLPALHHDAEMHNEPDEHNPGHHHALPKQQKQQEVPLRQHVRKVEEDHDMIAAAIAREAEDHPPRFGAVPRPREGASAAEIKGWANAVNDAQHIANLHDFSLRGDDYHVLVVMVHDRVNYARALVASLRKVRGIEKALLVISQDMYLPEMEDLLETIDFCPFLRIVYPLGLQMNPTSFPGTDPNDCARDLSKAAARAARCNNAENPDKYGHYREAPFTVVKHHWWWKAAYVFDRVNFLKGHRGYKVFLEGDHYLAPDALVTLTALDRANRALPTPASALVLGKYSDPTAGQFASVGTSAVLQMWDGTRDNMGMAINRKTWEEMKACKLDFCTYDDYNWDWTLLYLSSRKCFNGGTYGFVAASVEVGRVYHIGVCGMHVGRDRNGENCSPDHLIGSLEQVFRAASEHMFPSTMSIYTGNLYLRGLGDNGGWGDPRDHKLCMSFVTP